jgi:hypothetical protein
LRGGLDAWQRRGFPVEPLALAEELPIGKRAPALDGAARDAVTLRGLAPRRAQGL